MTKVTLPYKFTDNNMDKMVSSLESRFTGSLGAGLLFRRLSRTMIQSLMAFFTPVLARGNRATTSDQDLIKLHLFSMLLDLFDMKMSFRSLETLITLIFKG